MAYDITVTTSALPVVESRARAGSSTRLAQVMSIVRAHGEGLGAAAVYAAFALWALVPAAKMLEPDDYAYRASIITLSQGHFWLTNTQYTALAKSLSGGIQQWVHLANGHWISEKNPGYPFFAVVFQWLRIVRLTPLFTVRSGVPRSTAVPGAGSDAGAGSSRSSFTVRRGRQWSLPGGRRCRPSRTPR